MSNLSERIAARNKAEKFYCEVLYPTVTALLIDLGERELNGQKMVLATEKFSKAAQKIIDKALAPLLESTPKNVHFFVKADISGSHSQYLNLSCTAKYHRPSRCGSGCDYVYLAIPTLYVNGTDFKSYKEIKPPVYTELKVIDLTTARATLATVQEKIRVLKESESKCKYVLSEVGEA